MAGLFTLNSKSSSLSNVSVVQFSSMGAPDTIVALLTFQDRTKQQQKRNFTLKSVVFFFFGKQ